MPYRIHTTPLRSMPAWAVLERRLFADIEEAQRRFSEKYTGADGRLNWQGSFVDRDGVDDFYEPFFNWPTFYALGGSADILAASKRHWEGVTAQLSEAGMLTDEYENGYDWFHQGESLLFFYALCAADPSDRAFAERARRFAELYTDPAKANYDPVANIIRAPHNGALGPREGLGPQWQPYSAGQLEMRPYGLPLEHLDGIRRWEDLENPSNAQEMGRTMHRLAVGDVPVNLASTSLVVGRWLYDGDEASRSWVLRYVDGWMDRAAEHGGVIPDNVSPDGIAGGLHDGRWYGGHYGWGWPHGLHSVGMVALIGGINASLLSGDDRYLDLARNAIDTVLDNAITASVDETPFSMRASWLAKLGSGSSKPMTLVPYRYGRDGWFDYGPLSLDLPMWLWWWSRDPDDLARLTRAIEGYPAPDEHVMPFRDKLESGHEAPWLEFLQGRSPQYPEEALSMALGQVARRVAIMDSVELDPDGDHLHFWQRVNPVVTEILGQLISGTPQILYNGGLPFMAVAYDDLDAGRPGLPPDVAALVRELDGRRIVVEIVNTSHSAPRRVRVRPSRFGEQMITGVSSRGADGAVHPGASTAYASVPGTPFDEFHELAADAVVVDLPPAHRALLTLTVAPSGKRPSHRPSPREDAA